MAALAAAGHRALGSMGRIPAKRFAASRSASLRFDGLYIDASRSNPRTLSAPLWRIGRLRDFRAESVSQAIATSHGSEDERFDGEQRARPASRICDMRSLRPCRGRKGTFGRAQQGFIEASIEGCAGLFRLYAQRGELNHQPPIPLGSLYSGKPPCSIPEPPPFLEHKKREAVQMEQGGDFNMTSFRGAPLRHCEAELFRSRWIRSFGRTAFDAAIWTYRYIEEVRLMRPLLLRLVLFLCPFIAARTCLLVGTRTTFPYLNG